MQQLRDLRRHISPHLAPSRPISAGMSQPMGGEALSDLGEPLTASALPGGVDDEFGPFDAPGMGVGLGGGGL